MKRKVCIMESMNTDLTNTSPVEEEKFFPLKQILSGEEYTNISNSVEREFDYYINLLNEFHMPFDDTEVLSEVEKNPSELEIHDNFVRIMAEYTVPEKKTLEEVEEENASFVSSIKQIYTNTKLDIDMKDYSIKNPKFDTDDINYIDESQEKVIKGWIIFDTIRLYEKLQIAQMLESEKQDIEEMELSLPKWSLEKLIERRSQIQDRIFDRESDRLIHQFKQSIM